MKILNSIEISLAGLKDEDYKYEFNIDGGFFDNFELAEISKSDLTIGVHLTKSSNMMVFEVEIEGNVNVPCDSCGSDFDLAFKGNEKLIVNLGIEDNFDDEIWTMISFDSSINLSHFIYECVMVMLPAKKVHLENECDEEALENLSKYKVSKESNDPRWDKLKDLV